MGFGSLEFAVGCLGEGGRFYSVSRFLFEGVVGKLGGILVL